MCRGDISLSLTLCQQCIQDATKRISSECSSSKEAIIWYNKCLLRYSYHSLLLGIDTSAPKFIQFNIANTSHINLLQVVSYLSSHSLELPSPQEPTFFIHSRMNQEVTTQMESNHANNFVSFSVNEMSISEFYPRQ